jgi:hypothetical protein
VLKADVWRDHLLHEERGLNARLAELEKEGDDRRFEDAREEAEARLADVHERLTDMEAATGPARAAALLAGKFEFLFFSEGKAHTPSSQALGSQSRTSNGRRSLSVVAGGKSSPMCPGCYLIPYVLRMRLALARALFVKVFECI